MRKRTTRRNFLRLAAAGPLAFGLPSLALTGARLAHGAGPNGAIRLAMIGLGGIGTVGGVGGRGRQLITRFRTVPGVRIVALCDVDKAILEHGVNLFKGWHENVAAHTDLRKVLDDKNIDAVAVAVPNHWHALATVWACQAGKDVYVEKPLAYNIWEGRQMVAAARKYGRIVQVGTQRRASGVVRQLIEYLKSGAIGPVRRAHAIIYRGRNGIGKVAAPTPVPPTVDYDLWCGPAPVQPVMRKQLHYDWHWFWPTGNGEIGNNGPHSIDVCRWILGQDRPAPRAISFGGRFAFQDDGETPNTHVAFFDYRPAPLVCEIRNLHSQGGSLGKFRSIGSGVVIDCEGGSFVGDATGGSVLDKQGKKIKDISDGRKGEDLENLHAANFVEGVRSRNPRILNAEVREGYLSVACCHMANVSHRLGKQTPPEVIPESIRAKVELADAFGRCRDYLRENGVDLRATQGVLGPWVTFDADKDQFVGEFADQANQLSQRPYRAPFEVPKIV